MGPQLNEWYGQPTTWTCLYRASVDGFTGKPFHSKCDGKGPTLVIIQSDQGYVFGGFAAESWNSDFEFFEAKGSWLFSLRVPSKQLTKITCLKPHIALIGATDDMFAFGDDLYVFNHCDKLDPGALCNLGRSYDGHSVGVNPNEESGETFFAGSKYFKVHEIEVWAPSS